MFAGQHQYAYGLTMIYRSMFDAAFDGFGGQNNNIKTIDKHGVDYLAVLEDDMFPGADLVSYFSWAAKVMSADRICFSCFAPTTRMGLNAL